MLKTVFFQEIRQHKRDKRIDYSVTRFSKRIIKNHPLNKG
jgi:hypothetical protein